MSITKEIPQNSLFGASDSSIGIGHSNKELLRSLEILVWGFPWYFVRPCIRFDVAVFEKSMTKISTWHCQRCCSDTGESFYF